MKLEAIKMYTAYTITVKKACVFVLSSVCGNGPPVPCSTNWTQETYTTVQCYYITMLGIKRRVDKQRAALNMH